MKIEQALGRKLKRKKLTVAIAESCTGGLLASRITDVAGSSSFFKLTCFSHIFSLISFLLFPK